MGGVFFFFFKQKTAYEIYQCDWSSDVCSSDLKRYLWKVTGVGLLGTVTIAAVAGMFPVYWMTLFYGEAFAVYSDILVWYAFIYPIVFLSLMLDRKSVV